MTFPSWRVIVGLVVVWTLTLVVVKSVLDPRVATSAERKADAGAAVHLWFRVPCRGGACMPAVDDALGTVDGLGPPRHVQHEDIIREDEAQGDETVRYERTLALNRLEVPLTDPARVDFAALARAVEGVGFVPDRIEVHGLQHVVVVVGFDGLQTVARRPEVGGASEEAFAGALRYMLRSAADAIGHLVTEYKPRNRYTWFDSVGVGPLGRTLRFSPVLGAPVDMREVIDAVRSVGLAPGAIHIEPESGTLQ